MYVQTNGGFGRILAESTDMCQTPVEKFEQMCLPLEDRWKMYRNQSGRSFRYFLTDAEYNGYLNQFTFMREKRPQMYPDAIRARDDYKKAESFFPYYWNLRRAAEDASLMLDRQCNLSIRLRKESFLKLLLEETANKIRDQIVEEVFSLIGGERLAKFLGIFGSILELAALWDCERRKKLVNEQDGSMRAEAFRRKLSFVMDVMAQELAKKKPGSNPVHWKSWLIHQYNRFKPIRLRYSEYTALEQSLDPNFPKQPTIGPAR